MPEMSQFKRQSLIFVSSIMVLIMVIGLAAQSWIIFIFPLGFFLNIGIWFASHWISSNEP